MVAAEQWNRKIVKIASLYGFNGSSDPEFHSNAILALKDLYWNEQRSLNRDIALNSRN